MNEQVEIKVSYPPQEIKTAIAFYLLQINHLKTYLLATYAALALLIVLVLVFMQSAPLVLLFLLLGFLVYYFYYLRPLKSYCNFYLKRKGGIYKFAASGIVIIGDEIQSTMAWSVFNKAYETPTALLLLDDNQFVYVFPKICFADDLDLTNLRKILTEQIASFKPY